MSGPSIEAVPAGQQLVRVATELDDIARLGMWLAAAESGSKDAKAQGMAAALRIAYADRLGLPAHAAQEIHLIKGNLALSAKLCRALAHEHGIAVERVEETADSCTARLVDIASGKVIGKPVTYTLAMAKKQGLSGANWTNSPDRMLWARASKRALDDFAPWVTIGIVSQEEIGDVDPDEVLVGDLVGEDGKPFEDPD